MMLIKSALVMLARISESEEQKHQNFLSSNRGAVGDAQVPRVTFSRNKMPNRNKTPIREFDEFVCCMGHHLQMVRRLGMLMTIIGSLTAEACLVEGFASSMMGNEDGMNAARDLLMRQCTPVTYDKVDTHKIESIGGQKSSTARYLDHRRRCQNVKKEPP